MTKNDKALIAIAREIASLNTTTDEGIRRLRLCVISLKEIAANIATPNDYVPKTVADKAVIEAAFNVFRAHNMHCVGVPAMNALERAIKAHPDYKEEK